MSNPIRYGLDAGDGFGSVRTWNQTKIHNPDGSGGKWNRTGLDLFSVRTAKAIKLLRVAADTITARILPKKFHGT